MFTFSEAHSWQNDPAVQQILVFPNKKTKYEFEELYLKEVEKLGTENASDTGIGAIYKIRAVKVGNDMYIPIIRCGMSGVKLWEGITTYVYPKDALLKGLGYLKETTSECILKELEDLAKMD